MGSGMIGRIICAKLYNSNETIFLNIWWAINEYLSSVIR
jgi:hypothetical protein